MQNRMQAKKLLGIALIVTGLIGFAALGGPGGAFYGYGPSWMKHGAWQHAHGGYGHHWTGPGRHGGAQWSFMHDGAVMMPGMERMAWLEYGGGPALSDQQQQRISDVRRQYGQNRQPLLESLEQAQVKLQEMLQQDAPDSKLIGQQYARCAELRRQLFELDIEQWRHMEEVLTEDQRQEARKYRHWMMLGIDF